MNRSGPGNDDLRSRRNPDLAAALQPMGKPNSSGEGEERGQHDEAEGADEMAENGTESMAEEVAGGDEADRPHSSRQKIQNQESLPADGAHPHRERRQVTHSIDKPKGEDKTSIVAL